MMNYAFITLSQNAITQELELRGFASSNNIEIDAVFYDKSFKKEELRDRKEFLHFLHNLKSGDKIIVDSMDTLGWRVGELVQILAKVFDKNIEIICTQDNERLHGGMEAYILLSKLSKTRKQNIKMGRSTLGRPEGSRSKSKYDAYLPQIIEFLKTSRNISALARELNISRTSLKDYVVSRNL